MNNDWNNNGNWSGGQVPGALDDVTIDTVGLAAVVHSSGAHSILSLNVIGDDSLSITGGSLGVTNASFVSRLNLSGGLFNGGTLTTLTSASTFSGSATLSGNIRNEGVLSITSGDPNLNNVTLNNAGTIDNSGARLDFEAGSRVLNLANGVFDISGATSGAFFNNAGTSQGFDNLGTFRHSGSGSAAIGNVPFNNTGGTIDVTGGTLQLNGSGSYDTTTITVSPGNTLLLDGGAKTINGSFGGSGAGTVSFASTVLIAGTDGATLNFSPGLFNWSGSGSLAGGTFTNAGFIQLTDGDPNLNAATLRNAGTITNINARFDLEAGSELINLPGGLFDISGPGSGSFLNNSGTSLGFVNQGTLRHSGSGGAVSTVPFNNTGGTIDVTNGTLHLNSSGIYLNTNIAVTAGATLILDGGVKTISGMFAGSGAGTVSFNSTTLVAGAGATLNFPAGMFNWAGSGTLTGGTFANIGFIQLPGGDPNLNNGTLQNSGTIINSGARFDFEVGGRLVNLPNAVFDITSAASGSFLNNAGTALGFDNSGIFRHSGTGNAGIGNVPFNNAGGTIDVTDGTLQLNASGTYEATTITVAPTKTLILDGGTKIITGLFAGSGGGIVSFASSTLTTGSGATLNFPAGMFRWSGSGTITGGTFTNANYIQLTTGDPNLNNATLSNAGTIVNSGARFDFEPGGLLVNLDSAFFDITGAGNMAFLNNVGGLGVQNFGTFIHTGSGSASIGNVPFNDDAGRIEVTDGTLQLNSSGTYNNTTISVAAGKTLILDGGTKTITGTFAGTGAGTVSFASTVLTTTTGATLDFPAGMFNWSGSGTITGGTFTNAGFIQITNGDPNLNSATLNNAGTIINSGARFDIEAGGHLVNLASGVFDISGATNGSFLNNAGTGLGFDNFGIFRHSGAGAAGIGNVPFNNTGGTIDVTNGSLQLNASGTYADTNITVAAGATLILDGGIKTLSGTFGGSGLGTVTFASTTLRTNTGAILDFPVGMFNWSGSGTFTGGTFKNAGFIQINNGDPNLNAVTLNNAGTIINSSARLDFEAGGHLVNLASGVFDISGATNGSFLNNAGTSLGFDNFGIFRHSGAGAAGIANLPFHNTGGTIDVTGGTLQLNGSGNYLDTNITVVSGSTLILDGGTKTITGAFGGSGAGTVSFASTTLTTGEGATLNFPAGMFRWSGSGTLTGGTFTNIGVIQLVNGDPNLNNVTLRNAGTITSSSARLDFEAGGRLINLEGGVFDITGNASGSYLNNAGSTLGFDNFGTFRLSGTSAASTGNVPFSNGGTVETLAGSLQFNSSLAQFSGGTLTGGTWRTSNGSAINFQSGVAVNAATIVIQGSGGIPQLAALNTNTGSLSFLGGADFLTAALVNSGTLVLGPQSLLVVNSSYTQTSSGRLEIHLAGTPASGQSGRLAIGTSATLGGTLVIDTVNSFAPSAGDSYTPISFASRVGTFQTFEGFDQSFAPLFELVTNPTDIRVNSLIAAADLAITGATVPPTGLLGQDITIQYTVQNLQNRPATVSDWTDAIYLSRDEFFDEADFLFARVSHTGGLAALASYTENVQRAVPSLPEGDYHVLIVADNRRIMPDLDRSNNDILAGATLSLSVATLTLGSAVNGTIEEGQDVFYRLALPSGPDVFVTGDFELPNAAEFFVRFNAVPDRTHFDFKASSLADIEKQIRLLNPRAGDYYIMLHGREGASPDSDFTLVAESAPFVLDSIGQNFGANVGLVTVPLTGGGFTSALGAELRPLGGGAALAAQNIRVIDSFHAFATFDLSGIAPGDFTFVALQGGTERLLSDSFDVQTGELGRLEARLIVPSAVRMTRNYTFTVEFENRGGTDIATPLLTIDAAANSFIWANGQPQTEATPTLQFLAVDPNGLSGGVLRPGEKHSVVFNAVTNSNAATFTLSSTSSNSLDPVNYPALKETLRPVENPTLYGAAFDSIVTGFAAPTYGDLLDDLAAASDEARRLGATTRTLPELFHFLIEREFLTLPNANVQGVVLDGDLQHIAGRQALYLRNTTTDAVIEAYSFYDGRFGILDVPAGTYELSIDGFLSDSIDTITVPASGVVGGLNLLGDPGQLLIGRIVNDAGRPVANALVTATDALGRDVVAKTNGNGEYRIAGLAPGVATLDITAANLVPIDDMPITLLAGTKGTSDFTLSSGSSVEGRIVNTSGAPVANADVIARLIGGDAFSQTVKTDSLGRFKIAGLVAGTYEIVGTATGFGAGVKGSILVGGAGTTPVPDVALTVAGRVFGIITDSVTGLPIPGARFGPADIGRDDNPFLSNATGSYSASNLTAGTFEALITAPGHVPQRVELTLTPGEQENLNISLRPLGVIQGDVRINGALAGAGITVTLLATSPGGLQDDFTTVTDASGHWTFAGLMDGDYSVAVGAAGASYAAPASFTLNSADNTFDANLALAAGDVTGVVRSAGGLGVEGQLVRLFKNGDLVDTALTDSSGAYRFLVFTDGPVDIVAAGYAVGFLSKNAVNVAVGQPLAVADMVVGTAPLTVTVASAALGNPALQGAAILIRALGDASAAGLVYRGDTAADGTLLLPNLHPGDYEIEVRADGFAAQRQQITVAAGGGSTGLFLSPGITVAGIIRDASGAPLEAAYVAFRDRTTGAEYFAFTDGTGHFQNDTLASGDYDVIIGEEDFQPLTISNVHLTESNTNFQVNLQAGGGVLQGEVQDANGVALPGATVEFSGPGGIVLALAVSDQNGFYSFLHVPVGTTSVRVVAAGFQPATVNVTFAGGETQEINLAAGALISSAISAPSASPVPAPAPSLFGLLFFPGGAAGGGVALRGLLGGPGDVLSGIQPPSRFDVDTSDFRTRASQMTVDLDCIDVVKAQDKAILSGLKVFQVFDIYENSFEGMKALNDQDVTDAIYRARDLAIQLVTFANQVQAFAATAGTLAPSAAMTAGVSALKSAQVSIYLAADILKTEGVAAFAAAVPTLALDIGAVYSAVNNAKNAFAAAGMADNFARFISSAKNALDFSKDFREVVDGALLDRLEQYESGEDIYAKAVNDHIKNLRDLDAAMANAKKGKGKAGENPEDPKDKKKEDEEPIQSVGSRDPNDIIGPSGFGTQQFVAADQPFDYTIRFENIATATAAAQEVFVTQTLDADLDPSSFQLGDFGFGGVFVDVPDGVDFHSARLDLRATLGLFVDVEAKIDITTGQASWTFRALDPITLDLPGDPFAGFLPPNILSPEGEGFVSYSVRADAGAASGTVIDAQARIVFDTNAPIDTPAIVNTIDAEAPASQPAALPAITHAPRVNLQISSGDGAGSGVHSVDIYVSDNGGPFTLFVNDFKGTFVNFRGQNGHTYGFATVAKDNVGLTENLPLTADTSTTVEFDVLPFSKTTKVTFTEDDGDLVTVKLTGSGTGGLVLDDPDGDGKGAIDLILLDGSTTKTSLTVTVKRAKDGPDADKLPDGDGIVTIGDVEVTGSLGSFVAKSSDLTIGGYRSSGATKSIFVRDLLPLEPQLATPAIEVGGTTADKLSVTARDIGDSFTLSTLGVLIALKAASIGDGQISAAALGTLSTSVGAMDASLAIAGNAGVIAIKTGANAGTWNAANFGSVTLGATLDADLTATVGVGAVTVKTGSINGDIDANGAVKSVTVAAGAINGQVTGATIGSVKITGGDLAGFIGANAAPAKAKGLASLTITGGDLTGSVFVAGNAGPITTKENAKTTVGGAISGNVTANSFGVITASGGNVSGTIRSTATAAALAKISALAALNITGGDLLGDVFLGGALGTLNVKSAPKNGPGGNLDGATVTASKIAAILVAKNMEDSIVLAGASLGADGVTGGVGNNADSYGASTIGKVNIGGSVIASVIAAGLSTTNAVLSDNDDVIVGATSADQIKNTIASLIIQGTADPASYFAAGKFTAKPKINNVLIFDPASDARFLVVSA